MFVPLASAGSSPVSYFKTKFLSISFISCTVIKAEPPPSYVVMSCAIIIGTTVEDDDVKGNFNYQY